jgi:hypothetical protein
MKRLEIFIMANFDGLSGDWIGYYNYGSQQTRHHMELNLQFQGSVISGGGMDDVGRFSISGCILGLDVSWTKSYQSHSVEYQGSLDNNRIWGTWIIVFEHGGFLIWPRNGGDGGQRERPEAKPIEKEWLIGFPFAQPARK